MNNYFITQQPYTVSKKKKSPFINLVNKGLRFLKTGYNVQQLDTSVDMNTMEQRINYFHLLNSILTQDIPGDVVELGTFTGQCALLFQKVMESRQSGKQLYVYDSFFASFKLKGSVEDALIANFKKAGLQLPVIHKGDFKETLPAQLPEQIAFVHIDCGFGGDKFEHKEVMLHCFKSIYPRMPKGAICVLMDYNDPAENGTGHDVNPGVKLAFDEFFTSKPEEIICLYGNQYFHAYFRKA